MVARTRYEQAAERAVEWLAARLRDDGSYGPEVDDLACYYQSPYLFHLSGRTRDAARLLAFIRSRFMRADHDFVTTAGHKSDNAAFTEYWAYPNGWLAIAAQRMGRFDIAYPAFEYLRSCHELAQGGFRTGGPAGSSAADALTTAHLGLACLYFGDVPRAEGAGGWLARLLALQPGLRTGLFLLTSPTSHKVAWGAAVLARITGDVRCTELAVSIADHLIGIQDVSGAWLADQPAHTTFDQTAEIAIWLQEISAELATLQA